MSAERFIAVLLLWGGFLSLLWIVRHRNDEPDRAFESPQGGRLSCGCPGDGASGAEYGCNQCRRWSCHQHRVHPCGDPVIEQFRTAPRESGYLPAASLSPDEIATLADLERRLRASNTPYVTGFPTAEGDGK
jgi:hypothetical protein